MNNFNRNAEDSPVLYPEAAANERKLCPMKIVPSNFGYVEESIFRCGLPEPRHYSFLSSLRLKTCILLTDTLDLAFERWLEETGILAIHPLQLLRGGRDLLPADLCNGGYSAMGVGNDGSPNGSPTDTCAKKVMDEKSFLLKRAASPQSLAVPISDFAIKSFVSIIHSDRGNRGNNSGTPAVCRTGQRQTMTALSSADVGAGNGLCGSPSFEANPDTDGGVLSVKTETNSVVTPTGNLSFARGNSLSTMPWVGADSKTSELQPPAQSHLMGNFISQQPVGPAVPHVHPHHSNNIERFLRDHIDSTYTPLHPTGCITQKENFFLSSVGVRGGHCSAPYSCTDGPMSLPESVVVETLHYLVDPLYYPVLITCARGRYRTGLIVGCLRKLQRWNIVSILEEYRRFAGDKSRTENEEFIEYFYEGQIKLDLPNGRRPTILYDP